MTNKEYNVKVYQEVLEQIRLFIDQHHLSPGDRLPSERYLAETLKAGRSSVREALRAIELLGLIETRKGEGTFLKAYQPYHSVEILSSFILRESKKKEELMEFKKLLEEQAIKMVFGRIQQEDITYLQKTIDANPIEKERHYYFFNRLFERTENSLLIKVWQLMEEFTSTIHSINYETNTYELLIELLQKGDRSKIDAVINQLYEKEHVDKL